MFVENGSPNVFANLGEVQHCAPDKYATSPRSVIITHPDGYKRMTSPRSMGDNMRIGIYFFNSLMPMINDNMRSILPS
jgi:hypothetical protein